MTHDDRKMGWPYAHDYMVDIPREYVLRGRTLPRPPCPDDAAQRKTEDTVANEAMTAEAAVRHGLKTDWYHTMQMQRAAEHHQQLIRSNEGWQKAAEYQKTVHSQWVEITGQFAHLKAVHGSSSCRRILAELGVSMMRDLVPRQFDRALELLRQALNGYAWSRDPPKNSGWYVAQRVAGMDLNAPRTHVGELIRNWNAYLHKWSNGVPILKSGRTKCGLDVSLTYAQHEIMWLRPATSEEINGT